MDENIRYGKTDRCSTFNNPPLCASGDFEIRVLEVYGFAGAWKGDRTWHYDVSAYLIPYCHFSDSLLYIYRVVYIIYKYLRIIFVQNYRAFPVAVFCNASSVVYGVLVLLYVHVSLLRRYKKFCTDWDYVDLSPSFYYACLFDYLSRRFAETTRQFLRLLCRKFILYQDTEQHEIVANV